MSIFRREKIRAINLLNISKIIYIKISYCSMKIQAYSPEIEAQMLNFYKSLSEKDRHLIVD
jgi:hypothetical protein